MNDEQPVTLQIKSKSVDRSIRFRETDCIEALTKLDIVLVEFRKVRADMEKTHRQKYHEHWVGCPIRAAIS